MESIFNGTNGRHDVQVSAQTKRRRFTAEYKLKIVREADACTKPGELGALLRREGLYSSHLVDWRRARERGELLKPPRRGLPANSAGDADAASAPEAEAGAHRRRTAGGAGGAA